MSKMSKLEFHQSCAWPGAGWIEGITDQDMGLIHEDVAEAIIEYIGETDLDTRRLQFIATTGLIEGVVGVEKDLYEYASELAEERDHKEPTNIDLLDGLRKLLDAAAVLT